jgi:hypothetical protein
MSDIAIDPDLFGAADVAVPACQRSRVTNDPMRRHRGKTADARRVRDLYLSYMSALGNPLNAIVQANVAKAAELVAAAEIARAKLIDGAGDANQLVRIENLAARAVRSLGLPEANAAPAHVPLRERLAAAPARPSGEAPTSYSLRERLAAKVA